MQQIILIVLCGIVLAFGGLVYLAVRAWSAITTGKRIGSILLMSPIFLLIVCILVSLSLGHPAQGSMGFNRQFICAVLIVFILPLPTLVGAVSAFVLLARARKKS